MAKVSELFDLAYGHSLELNRLPLSSDEDAVNFVSRTAKNNGVSARVERIPNVDPAQAGTLSVALNGQGGAGLSFLQPAPFYCGFHVMILTPRTAMSDQEKLWWAACISANRFRFGFGRQANRSLAAMNLPDSIPAWAKAIPLPDFERIRLPFSPYSAPDLSTSLWKTFNYEQVFRMERGQRVTKAELKPGKIPYIRSSAINNGVTYFGDLPQFPGNAITVSSNGSVGEAFYQEDPFFASDDMIILRPRFRVNPAIAMFLCTIIRAERFRFNYGRKWFSERMRASTIRLPVTASTEVDTNLMEAYILSLPYSVGLA